MLKRLLFVAYFLEVGLLLVLVPWSGFWDRNYFAIAFPAFQEILNNNYVRGAVSGLGIVNLLLGFEELASVLWARRTHADHGDPQAVMICLVTDRRRLSAAGDDAADRLVELVAAAAGAGIDLIQIREPDLETAQSRTPRSRAAWTPCGARPPGLLVNDRTDVVLAAGAHGVHLRADSIDARAARALLSPDALVGRSVHSVEEAADASRAGGLDYLILGTLFETPSKDASRRLTTLDELSAACRASSVPVLAIGGMTVERALAAAQAGAAGIAGIGMFIPPSGQVWSAYLQRIAADLRRAFDTCGAVP